MADNWAFREIVNLLGGVVHRCRQSYLHIIVPSGSASEESRHRVERWARLWEEVEPDDNEGVAVAVLALLHGAPEEALDWGLRLPAVLIADLSRAIIEFGRRN